MTSADALLADRELRLLIACLRPLADPGRIDAIGAAAALPFNAERLLALAQGHRVNGFLEAGLAAAGHPLPPTQAALLAGRARTGRHQLLRNAGEEVRVGRALAAAGIDAVFVKGATLAMHAHGSLAFKTSWDIDLLVSRERMEEAGVVLGELGYRLKVLDGITDAAQIRRFLAVSKEAEWLNAARGTVVELHTELSDTRTAITGIGLKSPRQRVELMPGAAVATLAAGPLFAYLCFHGTAHLWARLKWLADIAALLRGADVAALHREAVTLGAGRTPGTAIVLAHELLGIAVPDELLAAIRRDRATRRLLRFSRAAIAATRPDGAQSVGEMIAHTRAQAWLVPGAAYRFEAIRSRLTRPFLAHHLRMPGWAVPVAVLTALPFRLLRRRERLRRQGIVVGGKVASKP